MTRAEALDRVIEIAFADVAFPADTLAAWLHAAFTNQGPTIGL